MSQARKYSRPQLMKQEYELQQEYHVLFAAILTIKLNGARDTYMLSLMEKAIAKADLLLLDELRYASFGQEESGFLFKVIAERPECINIMITTDFEFLRWLDIFANEMPVAALLDQLMFYSHVMNMNGASFCLDSHQMR